MKHEVSLNQRFRHCERSVAIQSSNALLDCFVASLLAMTEAASRFNLNSKSARNALNFRPFVSIKSTPADIIQYGTLSAFRAHASNTSFASI